MRVSLRPFLSLEAPQPRCLSGAAGGRTKGLALPENCCCCCYLHGLQGHWSSGLLVHVTLSFFQPCLDLRCSLHTEIYSPVSTANRSPITRQNRYWGHGGEGVEMAGTAGPARRGGW